MAKRQKKDESREEIIVYASIYPPTEVFRGTKKACRNFIGNYAYEHNNNGFRQWHRKGSNRYYFDCGDVTFFTYTNLEEDLEESEIKNDEN